MDRCGVARGGEFGFDQLAEFLRAERLHQDLDAGLVNVVAPTFEVVHAQDRFEIGEQILLRQEFADHVPDHRRAAEAAADQHLEAHFAGRVAHEMQADVVHARGGAILRRAGHGDLELARQIREFGMQRRPLPDVLAPRPRILELVGRHAREMIGSHVADAVAAGLDRVHLHRREQRQDVRHLLQLRPVVLDVLPRREMTVVAVVLARDASEHAHLRRRQQAVRNRNAQHRRVLLDVQAVAQPQRLEVVVGNLPREEPLRLVAELRDTLLD